MLYKALKTFAGLEKMRRGEVKDLKDDYIIKDLLKAGYIVPAEATPDEDAPHEDDKPADKPAEDEGVTSEDAPAKEPAKRTRAKRAKT